MCGAIDAAEMRGTDEGIKLFAELILSFCKEHREDKIQKVLRDYEYFDLIVSIYFAETYQKADKEIKNMVDVFVRVENRAKIDGIRRFRDLLSQLSESDIAKYSQKVIDDVEYREQLVKEFVGCSA